MVMFHSANNQIDMIPPDSRSGLSQESLLAREERCRNQAFASEAQMQQHSPNISFGETIGSPLVHLGGQL
ncbi:hypothetical protein TNCV_3877361 [Trichonephila clavipes]|uniref:Uncharacterized protein n=1 Tax=Trichonephila clavipes TaxID=2585209 RepID=A0A8X6SWR0_TRICX|nr:hypothetical protein TNCV_3877361 [Trichonephila clavipes]